MESDISSDPSNYTDCSDSEDEESTLPTNNGRHINHNHNNNNNNNNNIIDTKTNKVSVMNNDTSMYSTSSESSSSDDDYSANPVNHKYIDDNTNNNENNTHHLTQSLLTVHDNNNNNNNNNNTKNRKINPSILPIKVEEIYEDESSDEYSDDVSAYSYSPSEPLNSDDDYLPYDMQFEPLYTISTNNDNESRIKSSILPIKSEKPYNKSMVNDNRFIDNDSVYSYSAEPPSCSDDDEYDTKDIKFESLCSVLSMNMNNNNNKIKSEGLERKIKKMRQNLFIEPIKCELCNDTFNYHSSYREHMNDIHKMEKPYVCDQCPDDDRKRYKYKNGLDHHIKRQHEIGKIFKCTLCPKGFYDQKSFDLHQSVHDKKEKIKCKHCNDIFTEHSIYRKHVNQIHKIEQAYICNLCPNKETAKKYRSKAGLDKHIERDHEKVRNYKCHLCPKQFYEKQVLEQHQRVHDGLKPFKCNQCSMRYTQRNSLRQHITVVHKKQRNYHCKYCGQTFPALTGMKSHLVSQHGDDKYTRFECRTCHKRFYEKGSYYKHIDNAHRPKDPKKEKIKKGECYYPGCNKKYNSKNCAESVKYHLVAAHRDREYAKYECKKCDKLFYDKTSHRDHMTAKHPKRKKKKKKSKKLKQKRMVFDNNNNDN